MTIPPDTLSSALRLARRAAVLSLALTLYDLAMELAAGSDPPLRAVVRAFGAYAAYFVLAAAMLGILLRGIGEGARAASVATARLVVTTLACALCGAALMLLLNALVRRGLPIESKYVRYIGAYSLCLSALLVAGHVMTERSRAAGAALHDAQVARLAQERESAAAHLQLLQAQMEPHFIFNALANVRRLMRTDSEAARTLLSDLRRYLEQALPRLRDERMTLGREVELVRAFLAVHQVRMGKRLSFAIDLPEALAGHEVPPMALLTLAENALKHGLQSLVEGGRIDIAARVEGDRLVLSVADSGRGMGSGSGAGTGLANLRARLKSLHDGSARLSLEINEPRGVVARITLPLQRR